MPDYVARPNNVKGAVVGHQSSVALGEFCARHATARMSQSLGMQLGASRLQSTFAHKSLKHVSGAAAHLERAIARRCNSGGELDEKAIARSELDLDYPIEELGIVAFAVAGRRFTHDAYV
jgi:hypothetical protein